MVYLVPGLGADHRVFETLHLPGFATQTLVWEHPNKNEPIENYTTRMVAQMKVRPTVIVGLSFGGVIGAELKKHFPEAELILISSIASRKELPWWARFGASLRMNVIFTGNFMKLRNPIVRWIFGVEHGHPKELFNAILRDSDPDFLYWAFNAILNWKGNGSHRVHHIHGDKDRLLPMRFTSADICVKGGGHFMIISHGKEVSAILCEILTRIKSV